MKAAGGEEQAGKEDRHREYHPSGELIPTVRRVPERPVPCTQCRAQPSRVLILTFLCPSEHLIHGLLLLSAHCAFCPLSFSDIVSCSVTELSFSSDIFSCSVTEESRSQSFTITAMTSTTSSVLFVMPWPVPGGQIVTSPACTVLISPLSLYSAVPFMM